MASASAPQMGLTSELMENDITRAPVLASAVTSVPSKLKHVDGTQSPTPMSVPQVPTRLALIVTTAYSFG